MEDPIPTVVVEAAPTRSRSSAVSRDGDKSHHSANSQQLSLSQVPRSPSASSSDTSSLVSDTEDANLLGQSAPEPSSIPSDSSRQKMPDGRGTSLRTSITRDNRLASDLTHYGPRGSTSSVAGMSQMARERPSSNPSSARNSVDGSDAKTNGADSRSAANSTSNGASNGATQKQAVEDNLPTLSVTITTTLQKKLWGKLYTVFNLEVHFTNLEWEVNRRYREFQALNTQLHDLPVPREVRSRIPALPPRKLYGDNLAEDFVQERRRGLEQYLQTLSRIPEFACSAPFLAFVGALENHTEDEKITPHAVGRVFLDKAVSILDSGDVLLFKTDGVMPAVQRSMTSSTFDHVGIVCRIPHYSHHDFSLYILEATIDGVRKYPLRQRLLAWSLSDAQIAIRRLDYPRDNAFHKIISDFVTEMHGKKYGLNPMDAVRGVTSDDKNSFFCSEVVAMAYQRVGLLPADKPANSFLPVTFTQSAGLQLLKGHLEKEIVIVFHKPEVETAESNARHSIKKEPEGPEPDL